MADIFKIIHPEKHFNNYISLNTRPDGRPFHEQRNVKLNVNSITTAEASAVVKCGNTTVICGIQLEIASPRPEEPEMGFLVTNVETPPLCSPKCKPGPPQDHAQVTSKLVSDIIVNSKCIDLKDLCIVPHKLAWVVYCDIICIDNDGSLVDACVIALMASLKTLSLPTLTYDDEADTLEADATTRTKLKVNGLPVSTSFALYKHDERVIILADPTAYEEDMCGGVSSNLIICCNRDFLCGTQKFGGTNFPIDSQDEAIKIAMEKVEVIEKVIDACIAKDCSESLL